MKIEANSDGYLDVRLSLYVTEANTVRVLINGNVHPLFVGYDTVSKALKRVFDEFPKAVVTGEGDTALSRIVLDDIVADNSEPMVRIYRSPDPRDSGVYTYEELRLVDGELKREIKDATFLAQHLNNVELHRADYWYENSNRYYPRIEVAKALFSVQPRINAGALKGEFGKPEDKASALENVITNRLTRIDEQYVSHEISQVWIDNEGVVRGKVVPTGAFGGALVGQIKAGKKPEFRMRAMLQLESVDGKLQPQPGSLNIITFDIVDMKD